MVHFRVCNVAGHAQWREGIVSVRVSESVRVASRLDVSAANWLDRPYMVQVKESRSMDSDGCLHK